MRKRKKAESAEEIVEKLKKLLKSSLWEFTVAIDHFEMVSCEDGIDIDAGDGVQIHVSYNTESFSTDGKHMFYNPMRVLESFRLNKYEVLARDYMHVVFHMMLRDMVHYKETDARKLYDCYADIRVEILLNAIFGDDPDIDRRRILKPWQGAEFNYGQSLYRIRHSRPLCERIKRTAGLKRDEHSIWYGISDEQITAWKQIAKSILGQGDNIDQKMESLVENSSWGNEQGKCGDAEGDWTETIKAWKRPYKSYISQIREFLTMRECQRQARDTIDPMLYTYGLELYEDVPLIEERDDDETPSFDTIVIAVDTSGSCSGVTASRFLGEMSNLMRDFASMGTDGRIVLLQCDTVIQKEMKYDHLADAPMNADAMEMKGWGGTSFVPVFKRIDDIQKKEGRKIDALFYLTDGEGEYPKEKPEFPTFFIMEQKHNSYPNKEAKKLGIKILEMEAGNGSD